MIAICRVSKCKGAVPISGRTEHNYRKGETLNGEPIEQYDNSCPVELPHPTSSTPKLVGYAQAALKSVFAVGYEF